MSGRRAWPGVFLGLAALLVLPRASAAGPPAKKPTPALPGSAPYDTAPAAAHTIEITFKSKAAQEILSSLARPKYEPTDMKLLEDMPAIELAIRDSQRGADVFERDFAAAFDEKTRAAVFEFKAIRESREKWQALLSALAQREQDIVKLASRRAAALLPGDRMISARLDVYLTFGLASLGDHFVASDSGGREAMVLDLSRALADAEGETLDGQISRIARLVAGEAFRLAWAEYRSKSDAWQHPDPKLGTMDVLLRLVGERGPVAVYSIDENFFPLSTWLKEPMKRAVEDLNRRADRFAEIGENLERRMELTTETRRGDFANRVAGQVGAFLVDGIIQGSGLDALRQALREGPRSFFLAYDKAAAGMRDLPPLGKPIRDRIH